MLYSIRDVNIQAIWFFHNIYVNIYSSCNVKNKPFPFSNSFKHKSSFYYILNKYFKYENPVNLKIIKMYTNIGICVGGSTYSLYFENYNIS